MPRDPFESARQKHLQAVFQRAARQGYYEPGISPDLRKFEERIERTKSKMNTHLERHAPAWISRETVRLFEKHKGELKPSLSPRGVIQTETSPSAIAQRAIDNVNYRNETRMKRLAEIEQRMRDRLTNTPDDPGGSPTNKKGMRM